MSSTHSLRPRDLVLLQRSAGNQAVSRLLQVDIAPDVHAPAPGEVAPQERATPLGLADRLLDRVRLVTRRRPRSPVD
jgi:hypothetical protein